ncbi:MAG: hypothetical protein JRI36_11055 [Deltaproteobacteria bacterium]|nr:hypothetical protein [Deltaproteobacteria bacterium]
MSVSLIKIEYRKGMIEKGMTPENFPVKVWLGDEIQEDVRAAVEKEDLLSLGGIYGDRDIGEPAEYDHLRMTSEGKTVEITVFNRGISLFFMDDEKVRRIHRVLCKLDKPGGG